MTNAEKKDYAKILYVKETMTQKEIAQKVGVSEKTLSKWVNDNDWDRLKASIVITKEEQLRRIYNQISNLQADIDSREQGKRYAIPREADILSKLAAAARALETESSIADIVEVSKRFLNWLRLSDVDKAKEFARLLDGFIKDSMR